MKYLKAYLTALCLSATLISVTGQATIEEKLGTITAVLKDSSITDVERSQQNFRASALLFEVDNEKAIEYAKAGVFYALKDKKPKAMLFTHRILGKLYLATGKLDSAEVYTLASRNIAAEMKDTAATLDIDNVLGFLYMRQEKYEKSESLLSYVYRTADSLDIKSLKNSAGGNLSILYGVQGKSEKKIDLLLDILKEKDLSAKTESGTYYSIAQEYLRINDLAKVKNYAYRSITIAEANQLIELLGYDYLLLGETYLRESKSDSARMYLQRAAELDNILISSNGWLELGNLTFNEGDLKQARDFYEKAKKDATELTDLAIKESLSMLGLRLAMAEHDDRETLRIYEEELKPYGSKQLLNSSGVELRKNIFLAKTRLGIPIEEAEFQEFLTRSDSIYSAANTERIAEITEKYDNAKLAAENGEKEIAIAKQRIWISLILGLLGIVLAALYLVNKNRNERDRQNRLLQEKNEKIAQQKEEIKTLFKAQGHDTINQFVSMILDLQAQRRKFERIGVEPELLIGIEQQLLNYKVIQEMLQNEESNSVDLAEYVKIFCDSITDARNRAGVRLSINYSAPTVVVKANLVVKLGRILNELITNSSKHAKEVGGIIPINILIENAGDREIRLTYSDSGPRDENEQIIIHSGEEGIGIIKDLTEYMDGEIETYAEKDFDFVARFPV